MAKITAFLETTKIETTNRSYPTPTQFWIGNTWRSRKGGAKIHSGELKGRLSLEKGGTRVKRSLFQWLQGTIQHPFGRFVSNKKSGFSLYQSGQHRSRHTYFPWGSLCRYLSICPITPAFYRQFQWHAFFIKPACGLTKILLFRSPRSRGAMKAALCWITFDVIGYNDRNPCLHPAYDRFTMLRFFGELTSLNAER